MAAFCINTHSQEFKDAAKRLGVSQFELEQIAYKYGNQEGTFGQFPSDEYIKEQLDGVPNYNATEAQAELWKMRYSTPREFDTLEELNAAKKDALQYFDDKSVRGFVNADGKYELRVAEQSYLENPEKELLDTEDAARALTEKIITLEKSLRGKYIYEGTIKTSDGEIKVTISDTDKDSNQDKIWLSSGKSIFGAVSMSIETNLKDGIVGGSILFPSISVADRENNYNRINNPIRNQHASILKQVLNQFINFGKLYPKSKWEALASSKSFQIETKIQNLSSLLGVDVSPYFSLEQREVEETQEIQERVVIDARRLRDALSFVAEDTSFSSIEDAIQYNEAYNEASKIGFGKDNRRNRKQLENELHSANKERDALWNKIRSLKDEVRRMKSSPWAFDVEEDLPFQKSPDTGNVTGLPDQMTANEAFQILSKQYTPDSSEAKLSKLVFDALQKTGITFRAADLPPYWRGRFIASENVIEFNKRGILNNTLLHESIHAVTTYYMHAANTEGFSDDVKIAIKEIEECYNLLKEDFLDLHTKEGGDRNAIFSFYTNGEYYGLTNSAELVAEITRPEILSLIRDYDARHKGQNIFHRLIDAVAKFFGITKKYGSLEKTLKDALVTLITHPDKALMDRYALETKTAKENIGKLTDAPDTVTWNYKRDIVKLLPEEFDSEFDTELELAISEVDSKVDVSPEAHNIFTQSPIGTIFKVPSREGYGWFLLNGLPVIEGNTAKVPIKVINLNWLQTHTFDIATSQNGVAYMTNIKSLFGNVTQQDSQQGTQYVNHSGGALQSDTYWGEVGERYGVKSNHYYHGRKTPNGNTLQSEADFQEGLLKVKQAAQDMGRRWSDNYANLLARNWNQVKYSDAVYAVSSIVRPGETNKKGYLVRTLQVDGGTGYAVQMAINEGKPVYVFDQKTNQWYEYSYAQKDFVPTDTPTLTRNFAGIGTSTSLTDAGRKAIEDVYAKTFSQPQQQSQQTLDIWAGQNPTNADLSNFAYRPFTIPMGFQLPNGTFVSIPWQARSVEAAFQALKLNYTNKGTLEEEAENNEIQKAILSGRWQSEREDGAAVKRLGNKIKNLNQPAWNRDRQVIMKELIKMSFQQNPQALQRLLATGDAILTHNRESSESIWRTEFPRILMEVRSELRAEQSVTTTPETASQEEPMWAPPKVERAFHEGQTTIVTKMDNLLKSGTLTVAEVMDEANKAMDWISDQITQYLEDPELVWSKYKSSEDKNDVVARVSKMSRKELVDYIGVPNIINIYAAEVLSPTEDTVNADGSVTKGNKELFKALGRQGRANYRLIRDNIDGLIQYGYTRFLAREGFGFQLSDVEGEGFTTTEEISPEDRVNVDNFNATDNIDGDEETRNQQEHWMIENATRDIMDNASVKVKQAIADCYLLEDNGKVKEDGTPDYDIAKDKLNRNERIVPIQAVRSIVKWIQGATKLSQMIERLEAQVPANPWVSQLVTRLKDTSGEESDFQSQFFNTFEKHFQAYSVVKMNPDGSYYTMTVNVNPALADALENMAVTRKVGGWSLVNENGLVNLSALEDFKGYGDTLESLGPLDEDTREGAIDMVGRILFTLGLPQTPEVIDRLLTESFKNDIILNVKNIADKLAEVSKNNVKDYNPFEYGGKYGIRGFATTIIKPFTNLLEETMVSSVFDSGKMYQSYLTPSWTTKLFQKMHLPDREFKEFILDEFGSSEWFIEPNTNLLADLNEKSLEGLTEQERDAAILQAKIDYISDPKHSNIWRTPWLAALMRMTPKEREEAFQHKVQLNFNKQNYMRGMDDLTYVMSVFTEYFSVSAKGAGGNMFAYYRFPMLSNKPSNEFVKFIRYANIGTPEVRGADANAILRGYVSIFRQELSRIQTVEMRNLKEGDEGYIANFDANNGKGSGLRFNFLDYLNEYLTGEKKTTALGQLLNRKLHATQSSAITEHAGNTLFALTAEENSQLEELVKEEIAKHLDGLANRLIEKYKANGLFEALKSIEGVGKTDFDVEGAIREFAWNDNFAQANLLQILVTDKAFYKNEEDLQKRLAQVHSPGTRGNWEALDFGERDKKGNVIRPPQRVSDGKLRVLKLKDYKEVKESIIENLKAVFDKKVEDAPTDQKQAMMDLRDNIIGAFEEINVVDGQAFVSPTAYRKKAFAFGEWTKDDERIYKNLLDGRFNMPDIKRVFNPRKPFTYGKTTKQISASLGTPIKSLRYGVQYKDSEYLLIMADALLKGQETGRPNLLGAIFDVMENSYKTNPTEGLDFAVFDSGVKTGLSGAISISEFIDAEDGQRLATEKIQSLIYQGGKLGGAYNENYIDVLDAEDYTTQQSVPEHFMHGSLQWGSQIRALMPSDLETSYDGQPVVYEYTDPATGETIQKSAEEIRKDWEENTKKMVDLSVEELRKELGLVEGMSIADSNVLISKILQREILSNPRYGVDLLLACSVDAEGNFRIPLGDPIQSKRVEQLLNSIIKNRINKQKVAGGTLVEVTNFGTSKRLNIRFKDKNDATGKKLLDTRAEYLAKGHTQKEFEDYVKENQGGIAYYECYAPAWTRDLFLKFADEKGNIDIEAIEMLEPDLLKMYGYRIPTEDKYSTAPYKIVGFLPQEAGDGFMQPWETTVIDGSDFDVDKKNLMRMDLSLKSALLSKKEFFEQEGLEEDTEENDKKYQQYRGKAVSTSEILKKLGDLREFSVSELEKTDIDWYEKSLYRRDREALKEERNARNEQAEETFERRYREQGLDKLGDAINELENREDLTAADEEKLEEYRKDYDKKYDKLTKSVDAIRANNEKWYKEAVEERRKRLGDTLRKAVIKRMLQYGIFKNSSQIPENERALFKAVKQAYIDLAFKVERPEAGTRGYYNNLMFNMQWAIATHASTADKMLNPGNFDPQKRAGYMVEANRLGYDWDELQKMSIGELKDLVFTSKNLMDFDVQTQFYKQNSVAGQVLGIFAVAKSAHAMFESRDYGILIERPFYIDGMEFSGAMHYDQKYDRKGNLIGKTLGSLVGASADAVKDPVLNLMNINKETINVLNTALRLGLDFETAALLLSSKAVSDVIETYRKNSLVMKTSFEREIKAVLRELEKNEYIGKDSALQRQNLTNEEMVWSIRGLEAERPTEDEIKNANIIKYKVLNAVLGLSYASRTAQPLSDLSRLNSITSAPGPLYINTIVSDRKFGTAMSMDGIIKFSTGEDGVENYVPATRSMVFDELKSLGAFYQSYDIAKQLFKRLNFTTASDRFEQLLGIIHPEMEFSIYSNEALLKSLADFFQSFLLVQSGVIKSSALKRYTTEFVTDYMAGKYTKDEKVANNPLIKAIQPKLISKKGQPDRYALNIDTTGMEQPEKDALSAGWTQLEKDNPELSHMLFAYNFFRGGIGFSPKTFMGLVPIQVKEGIAGYNETFEHLPEIGDYYSIFDQWVRNNWTNTELVTKITTKPCDENTKTITFKGYREMSFVYNSPYIRVSTKNGDFLFVRTNSSKTEATFTKIDPLGGNREYLEIYPTDTPVTAVDNLQRGLATLETQESEIVERKEDNPDVEQTPEEQTRDLTDFYQVAFAEETSFEETRDVTDSQFEEANKDLDIQTNKDKFDDIMDNFC